MNQNQNSRFGLSSAALHIMAMAFMLLDHAWATIFLQYEWMTCVGRLAFPIFAFMIAEGFSHTKNVNKYMLRMLIFAIISEIPFNLMHEGEVINPFAQNVLWTFLIGLLGLRLMEKARRTNKLWLLIIVEAAVCILGYVLGLICFVDYYGWGVLTVFVFYIFNRNREDNIVSKIWKNGNNQRTIWICICLVCQVACLFYINVKGIRGLYYDVNLFGKSVEIVQQGLAMLALIPIWLYNGKQGYHAKWFKYFNYAFYPVHCLILALIALYL